MSKNHEHPDQEYELERLCSNTRRSLGTPRPDNDVGIEYIWDIENEILDQDHLPGQVVHLNGTVRNFGDNDISTPFIIIFNISDDGYPQYYYEDNMTFPTCIGLLIFKAKTSYNVTWNWTAPKPNEMPPGSKNDFSTSDVTFTLNIATTLNGDTNLTNDQKSKEITVIKPRYNVKLKNGWWLKNGSDMDWYGKNKYIFIILPGTINKFELPFTLENLGDPTFIKYEVVAPYDWIAVAPSRQFWLSSTNSSEMEENLSIMVFTSKNLEHLPSGKDLKI